MKTEHTPEPWGLRDDYKGSVYFREQCVARCCEPQSEANARRIVACVNACAGIETFMLEMLLENKRTVMQDLDDLANQRDELLSDVERCYRMLLSEPDTQGALFKAENILREAIASVKEKA